MKVFVVNTGSSTIKLSLIENLVTHAASTAAFGPTNDVTSLIRRFSEEAGPFDAVGHRIVHGGMLFTEPTVLTPGDEERLSAIAELAPLHNPQALSAVRAVHELIPGIPQVGCFDTSFHSTLSPAASTYAIPRSWSERWGIRRFGFHGLSHAWASKRAATLMGRPLKELRIVVAHLGSGASLAAVAGGRSVDTTMGYTPMDGLVMAKRPGSLDPGLVLWLARRAEVGSLAELEQAFEQESGLEGLAGTSDMRQVMQGAEEGSPDALLAYGVYLHRLVSHLGSMVAVMGGVDVLVFTGGVGEHSARLRADVASRLQFLGISLDPVLNEDGRGDRLISSPSATVATAVVEAREDLEIAGAVTRLLSGLL